LRRNPKANPNAALAQIDQALALESAMIRPSTIARRGIGCGQQPVAAFGAVVSSQAAPGPAADASAVWPTGRMTVTGQWA